jgi:hypothetical protein
MKFPAGPLMDVSPQYVKPDYHDVEGVEGSEELRAANDGPYGRIT